MHNNSQLKHIEGLVDCYLVWWGRFFCSIKHDLNSVHCNCPKMLNYTQKMLLEHISFVAQVDCASLYPHSLLLGSIVHVLSTWSFNVQRNEHANDEWCQRWCEMTDRYEHYQLIDNALKGACERFSIYLTCHNVPNGHRNDAWPRERCLTPNKQNKQTNKQTRRKEPPRCCEPSMLLRNRLVIAVRSKGEHVCILYSTTKIGLSITVYVRK